MGGSKLYWLPWLIALVIVSLGFNVYLHFQHRKVDTSVPSENAELYVCPMHPQVVSDHPADCPICGMKLVKRQGGSTTDSGLDSLAMSVHLTPTQEIMANVRTEHPVRERLAATKTLPGRIVAKEDRQWTMNARVMGRIDRIYIATSGMTVRQGQPLYDYFSPDLASAQREYRLAEHTSDDVTRNTLLRAARAKLASLGMQENQISVLENTGEVKDVLTFHAPQSGVLMEKMATEGDWAMPGMTILAFADLSEVWVEGTLYESDMEKVHMGDSVTITASETSRTKTPATISYISPMVDMETRTLVFRAELANRDLLWRPEQFVRVIHEGKRSSEVLSIPVDAVLFTGEATRVWVKVGDGRFQPRDVLVGTRQDGRIAVLSGLEESDEIVVSGGYLIDSDAQMKSIASAHQHEGVSKESSSAEHSVHSTQTEESMAAPTTQGQYYCTMCPQITSDEPGRCSNCGMKLVKREG